MGLHLHGRLAGGRRRCTRSRTCRSRRSRRQLTETSELLGTNLRLYQIHSATLESGVLDDPAVLEELARLRASGVAIGFTVTGPDKRETIERALEVGGFDAVQATWNLLERARGFRPRGCRTRRGIGVIVKEALANGRLTDRGDVTELAAAASDAGSTPDALALAVVLAQPWADVVLSGAATVPRAREQPRLRSSWSSTRTRSSGSKPCARTRARTGASERATAVELIQVGRATALLSALRYS